MVMGQNVARDSGGGLFPIPGGWPAPGKHVGVVAGTREACGCGDRHLGSMWVWWPAPGKQVGVVAGTQEACGCGDQHPGSMWVWWPAPRKHVGVVTST